MSVVLACAYDPRGEIPRLERYFPRLREMYDCFVVALRSNPETDGETTARLTALGMKYAFFEGWSGRHTVLKLALETEADFIHYVDMDRVIRWVETRPDELRQTVEQLQRSDCLIMGRTEAAYLTHPKALYETEMLPNDYFSHWFGKKMDFCAGSKGFSRRAAELIVQHSSADNSLRMDVEWPVMLHHAGYTLDYVEVDGLDWESADQYQPQAADVERQLRIAEEYDSKAEHWALRVRVARDITRFGIAAIEQNTKPENHHV